MILFFVIIFLTVVLLLMIQGTRIVPQQQAWVVQRLGRYKRTLQPGLNWIHSGNRLCRFSSFSERGSD